MHTSALIIDDDEIFQSVAEAALEELGFNTVQTACDGIEGLALLSNASESFDLILCDLQMPNMDGAKTIRELGEIGYDGAIVIVSGEDAILLESVLQMAKLANVDVRGALSKPLVLGELKKLAERRTQNNSRDADAIDKDSLLHALQTKQLRPYYQPKIDLLTNRVEGFEVLCRHVDDQGVIGAPMPYIRSAMTCSLIGTLTRSMIEQVIDETAAWKHRLGDFNLAINMSPACILNPNLPDKISQKFKSAGFDLGSITFEVTEDRLLEDQAVISEVLSRLRLAGFRLSLDDFGTGAASIAQLRRFPFHEVKIDQQFVKNAATDEFSRYTVEAAVNLSKLRGMTVVAEGVETEDMLNMVKRLGATTAQGFLYSPALAPEMVFDWVREHNSTWAVAA